MKNIEVEDVYTWDYPDFADAYISYAEHDDGTSYTDEELNKLNEENGDLVYEAALEFYR
jgi:hypothetical protein